MASEILSKAPLPTPENWLGPFYLSVVIDQVSLGILCGQVWTYCSSFPKDPMWVKWLVGLSFCLSSFTVCRSCYAVWEINILRFGDWDHALELNWVFCTSPFIATLLQNTAQIFFIWRCYALTGWNRPLLVSLTALMLAGLMLSGGLSAQLMSDPYDTDEIQAWALPMLVTSIVFDGAITLIVAYKLISPTKGDNKNTDSILAKLLAVTLQSASPPIITQIAGIGIQFGKESSLLTWNYLMGELISRLYVYSFMYNLNSRLEIRQLSQEMRPASLPEPQSAMQLSEIRFRRAERDSTTVSMF